MPAALRKSARAFRYAAPQDVATLTGAKLQTTDHRLAAGPLICRLTPGSTWFTGSSRRHGSRVGQVLRKGLESLRPCEALASECFHRPVFDESTLEARR